MCLGNCFPISIRSIFFILASLLCRAVTADAVKQYWKALWQCASENTNTIQYNYLSVCAFKPKFAHSVCAFKHFLD